MLRFLPLSRAGSEPGSFWRIPLQSLPSARSEALAGRTSEREVRDGTVGWHAQNELNQSAIKQRVAVFNFQP
ncbi:MAG: hypothetical protein OXD44_03115 [Gammaproteobacteria bacterium]|nr:hypothetical protein [Gammaproteobacteria bacterium]MCY4226267.1 hypothetical protein [Gammaproteobacteria bacterium]MCY4312682.1 hypothetical protein [Gammaproteobacteria bacterium]